MSLPINNPDLIKKFIPQREPIIMVDVLLDFDEKKVVGGLTITEDNIFVANDDFNEPGIVEHMAQTVALHTGYRYYLRNEDAPTGYIGSIRNIEVKRLPKVGESIVTETQILQEVMGVTLVNITSKVNDEIISFGEMRTVIAPE